MVASFGGFAEARLCRVNLSRAWSSCRPHSAVGHGLFECLLGMSRCGMRLTERGLFALVEGVRILRTTAIVSAVAKTEWFSLGQVALFRAVFGAVAGPSRSGGRRSRAASEVELLAILIV